MLRIAGHVRVPLHFEFPPFHLFEPVGRERPEPFSLFETETFPPRRPIDPANIVIDLSNPLTDRGIQIIETGPHIFCEVTDDSLIPDSPMQIRGW